jgi:hypothetical protein
MKTKFIFLSVLCCFFLSKSVYAQTGSSDPVYLEVISNSSKTVNFTVGVYPMTCKYSEENKRTYLTMKVLNKSEQTFEWTKSNKVLVVLEDYTLAFNYNTVAENGLYACVYSVAPQAVHEQTLCFDGKFNVSDIKNIYLLENGSIFKLYYYAGKN